MSALLLPLWIYLLVSEWGGEGGGRGEKEGSVCVCIMSALPLPLWIYPLVSRGEGRRGEGGVCVRV